MRLCPCDEVYLVRLRRSGLRALVWLGPVALLVTGCGSTTTQDDASRPGTRVLLDAHNCYPYQGRFDDRIDRALATGLPLAIEQDLVWYIDPQTGTGRSILSHGAPFTGQEPSLEEYFFQRIRPLMEQALAEDRRQDWPLITLNLDFKTNEPEHHAVIWEVLGRYEHWLTIAPRTASPDDDIAELQVGPLLVLTGTADEQAHFFHDRVPVGWSLRLFGAVHPHVAQAGTPAEARVTAGEELPDVSPAPKTNYRRWWNNPWSVVELGGQVEAGEWTAKDRQRLDRLVEAAHDEGLWIRFYVLNGHDPGDKSGGWSDSYNFGSIEAVRARWDAAIDAGVDFVAVDQYEEFAAFQRHKGTVPLEALRGTGALRHLSLYPSRSKIP